MNTWISRITLTLVTGLVLAACSDLPGPGSGDGPPPLKQATLGNGMVYLVPPDGFCIDRKSLRDRFALMARCDALGAGRGGSSTSKALITASLAQTELSDSAPIAAAAETELASATDGPLRLSAVKGTPPSDQMSERFWRGAAPIGAYVLGLAVYSPQDNPSTDAVSTGLLKQTYARTEAQTVARNATPATAEAKAGATETPQKNRRRGLFAGLFQ